MDGVPCLYYGRCVECLREQLHHQKANPMDVPELEALILMRLHGRDNVSYRVFLQAEIHQPYTF